MPLSSRMPDLTVLLAIAETGSLVAAARKVGLAQPAVSARLAAVEARIAVQSYGA